MNVIYSLEGFPNVQWELRQWPLGWLDNGNLDNGHWGGWTMAVADQVGSRVLWILNLDSGTMGSLWSKGIWKEWSGILLLPLIKPQISMSLSVSAVPMVLFGPCIKCLLPLATCMGCYKQNKYILYFHYSCPDITRLDERFISCWKANSPPHVL